MDITGQMTRRPPPLTQRRLRRQQLLHDHKHRLQPTLAQKGDRSKDRLFNTVWYAADNQITAFQHLELGKMILVAEDPRLE